MVGRKLFMSLFLIVLLSIVVGVRADDERLPDGVQRAVNMVGSDLLEYHLGIWYVLQPHPADGEMLRAEQDFQHQYEGILHSGREYKSGLVGRITSQYFRSDYYVAYSRLTQAVAAPGFRLLSRSREAESFRIPGNRQLLRHCPDESDSVLRYLRNDSLIPVLDSAEAVEAAIDIATIASCDWPVIVLDSIGDIVIFSNAVSDDAFWVEARHDDSLALLMTSPRLLHVGRNEYFKSPYFTQCYDSLRQDDFADVIKPPNALGRQEGGHLVTLYLWSTDGGELLRWGIVFDDKGEFEATKSFLTHSFAYCFWFV